MKVLYLTDDRTTYKMGNYYVDWIQAFEKYSDKIYMYGPGYDLHEDEIPSDIDLVVYGHSFMELLLRKKLRIFSANPFSKFDFKKYESTPSILFSKNEYKLMEERIEFAKRLKSCFLVCYCRHSYRSFKVSYKNIVWIPFGVNREFFFDRGNNRAIDVGMRGNRHGSHIGLLRVGVADRLLDMKYTHNDVVLSNNGEDFLFGDNYINWLNNCKFVGNTKSALDIVNPKFMESISCGAIPVCPIDEYEGILECGKHYVNVDDLTLLKNKSEFLDFYQSKTDEMKPHLSKLVDRLDYQRLLVELLQIVDKGVPVDEVVW